MALKRILKDLPCSYNSVLVVMKYDVRALAATPKGMTRQEIIDVCGLSSGGRTTLILEELEESGFIHSVVPYDKNSRDSIYRLIDEFSIFYLKFMDKACIQERIRGGR